MKKIHALAWIFFRSYLVIINVKKHLDGLSTLVIGGNMVKILSWYDNEWGFSNRLVDLAVLMDKKGL